MVGRFTCFGLDLIGLKHSLNSDTIVPPVLSMSMDNIWFGYYHWGEFGWTNFEAIYSEVPNPLVYEFEGYLRMESNLQSCGNEFSKKRLLIGSESFLLVCCDNLDLGGKILNYLNAFFGYSLRKLFTSSETLITLIYDKICKCW